MQSEVITCDVTDREEVCEETRTANDQKVLRMQIKDSTPTYSALLTKPFGLSPQPLNNAFLTTRRYRSFWQSLFGNPERSDHPLQLMLFYPINPTNGLSSSLFCRRRAQRIELLIA